MGQLHPAVSIGKVLLMHPSNHLQMLPELLCQAPRQQGPPIFVSLAVSHRDGIAGDIEILDPQTQSLS